VTPREGRAIYAVILAADPDLSIVECIGVVEAEDEVDAMHDVLQWHHTPSPAELATARGWSVLADNEPGGPLVVAEIIADPDMAYEEAQENTYNSLGGMPALRALDDFALDAMVRGLLSSFGRHPPA
jgi:hypothetical protein